MATTATWRQSCHWKADERRGPCHPIWNLVPICDGRCLYAEPVQAGDQTLTSEYVVIGTGQRDSVLGNYPHQLDIEITLIVDTEGHFASAAIYGSEGGAWIDFLTLAINAKLTAADLHSQIFAFPTQTYMLATLLEERSHSCHQSEWIC